MNYRNLQEILEHFGFTFVSSSKLGGSSFRVKAKSLDGSSEELVLKRHAKSPHKELMLKENFSADGFNIIPEFLRTTEGNSFVVLNEEYWTVQIFITSKQAYDWLNFDCSVEDCALAGRTLAAIHISGAKILKSQSVILEQSLKLIVTKVALEFDEVKSLFDRARPTSDADPFFQASERIFALETQQFSSRVQQYCNEVLNLEQSQAQTINHGDYHAGNLIFPKAGIFVIDWEFACLASPLYDLSFALFLFCLKPEGIDKSNLFSSRKTEAFLEGYSSAEGADVTSLMTQMQHLNVYSEFIYALMLLWVMSEWMKEGSCYSSHPGFGKLALALTYCCQ